MFTTKTAIKYIPGAIIGLLLGFYSADSIDALQEEYHFTHDNTTFYDNPYMDQIKPELLEGIKGIYYSPLDNLGLENNRTVRGQYWKSRKSIKISMNESIYDPGEFKIVFCHEVLHHYWYTKMQPEERQFWNNSFNIVKDFYKKNYRDEIEFHAYFMSKNFPEVCYRT